MGERQNTRRGRDGGIHIVLTVCTFILSVVFHVNPQNKHIKLGRYTNMFRPSFLQRKQLRDFLYVSLDDTAFLGIFLKETVGIFERTVMRSRN